jgi:hypothetical protein
MVCLGWGGLTHEAAGQSARNKKHRFSVYVGGGPNVYFNNLVFLKSKVNALNYSFSGKILWEPEHRLSIGIETGYFRLYGIDLSGPKNTSVRNSAIPIQLVVSMRVFKSFYGSFSIGRAFLINDVTTDAYGNFDATTFSLADFSSTVGYRRQLNNRYSLGVEAKYYYSSKAEDSNLALLCMVGYSFR